MKKQTMIIAGVAIVVIVVILILVFSLGSGSKVENTNQGIQPGDQPRATTLSEKDKYVKFEAELTCMLASSASAQDIMDTMAQAAPLMEEYGYSNEDYQNLKAKYAEQSDFQGLVVAEMRKQCPETVSQMGL